MEREGAKKRRGTGPIYYKGEVLHYFRTCKFHCPPEKICASEAGKFIGFQERLVCLQASVIV